MHNPVGQTIDGYRILDVLGQGGMGIVYSAEDVALGRTVAVKMIDPGYARNASFLKRFRSEARALARISSPHIVNVHALRKTDLGLFIVMEYVDGGTLADVMQEGPVPLERSIQITKEMLLALKHAHEVGVIHRDIKPRNIMLTKSGQVKVTDFGLAKVREGDGHSTVTQGMAGTLFYMSPEQVKGSQHIDYRTDLYSLGMTLYEMTAGRLPFKREDSEFTVMKQIVEEEIPSPVRYRSDIPRELALIISRSIAKDPVRRYSGAAEMYDALVALESSAKLPKAGGARRRGSAGRTKRPWPVYAAGGLAVLAILALGVLIMRSGTGREDLPPAVTEVQEPVAGSLALEDGLLEDTGPGYDEGPALEEPPEGPVAEEPVQAVPEGWLLVETDPPGARIYLDGADRGQTPATIRNLPARSYNVRLEREGYEPYITSTLLEADELTRLQADLSPMTVNVRISVRPYGDVYVNGELFEESVSFAREFEVPAGEISVMAVHPQLGRLVRQVSADPDDLVHFNLQQESSLNVTAFDENGNYVSGPIYIDGAPTGRHTPSSISVNVGERTVEVRADGYRQVGLRVNQDSGPPTPGSVLHVDPDADEPVIVHSILERTEGS